MKQNTKENYLTHWCKPPWVFSSLLFSSPVTILVSSRLLFSFFRSLQLRRVHAQTDGRRRRKSSTDLAFLVAVRGGLCQF
jgi:hypothetical protein